MGNLPGQLIPTAIVGALAPLPIIIVVTLLMSKDGLVTAIGFGAALVAVFAVIGVIVLATSSGRSGSGSGSKVGGYRNDHVTRVIVAGAGPSGQRIGRRRARTEHLVLPCG
jgi:hypothetical protein